MPARREVRLSEDVHALRKWLRRVPGWRARVARALLLVAVPLAAAGLLRELLMVMSLARALIRWRLPRGDKRRVG